MIALHIFIALSSLILSTFLYFYPTETRLKISYTTVLLTFVTGTYLVLFNHANLVRTCITGLVYLGFVAYAIYSARVKLLKA